jgi:hypothetical protein
MRLASKHYATHLAGSKVRVFDPVRLSEKRLQRLTLPAVNAPLKNDKSKFGTVRYHLTATPYSYYSDHAYVDFANRLIMGGALSGGFVQEEIMMLTSNFLPHGADVRGNNRRGMRIAPHVSLMELDRLLAVIKARQFLTLDLQHEIYGGKLETVQPFNPYRYLKVSPKPADIYMVAMAAKYYPRGAKYTAQEIKQLITLATRGFLNAMLAQHSDRKPIKIHTGQWGAGAFNNSRSMTWAVQRVAFEAAHKMFVAKTKSKQPVDLYFNAFSKSGVTAIRGAHNSLAQNLKPGMRVGAVADWLYQRSQQDPNWQVK